MNIQSSISRLEKEYNPEKDLAAGDPFVTKADYLLLECVRELISRVEELEAKLEDMPEHFDVS